MTARRVWTAKGKAGDYDTAVEEAFLDDNLTHAEREERDAPPPCRSGHTDCTVDCGWCKGTGYEYR